MRSPLPRARSANARAGQAGEAKKEKLTTVTLLAFNDFHGHLEPSTPGTIQVGCCNTSSTGVKTAITVPAGGAEYFATHMKALGSERGGHATSSARET